MDNLKNFLGTRKFWVPIITFVMMIIQWAAPAYFGYAISEEVQAIATAALWGIAGLIVHGDIRYDWKELDESNSQLFSSCIGWPVRQLRSGHTNRDLVNGHVRS